jgi:uncharacterized protein (TIGR03435 family)
MRPAFAVCALVLSAAGLPGQSPGPAFEVASIKPSPRDAIAMHMAFDRGSLSIHGATLQFCVEAAWGLQDFEIAGGPSWFANDRYDIQAKPPEGATQSQLMRMLQALLIDRFQFQFHREEKLVPGYAIVVARSGSKLKPAAEGGRPGSGMGRGMVNGTAAPVSRLAEALARVLGRPVADETGLTGNYDFRLTWTPADTEPNMQPGAPSGPAGLASEPGPTVFTAIQEQLGLRLEARRLPVQALVIDRVSRPTEN